VTEIKLKSTELKNLSQGNTFEFEGDIFMLCGTNDMDEMTDHNNIVVLLRDGELIGFNNDDEVTIVKYKAIEDN
jgi:hypothetical protein